jgi:spore coat protein U-like protein
VQHAADCQLSVQTFDFGRGRSSPFTQLLLVNNTLSGTCTRSLQAEGRIVEVSYRIRAVPAEPNRFMRDSDLGYLSYGMYVDSARIRPWGDGTTNGTSVFEGSLRLRDSERSGTFSHVVYGKVPDGQIARPGHWLGLVAIAMDYELSCR